MLALTYPSSRLFQLAPRPPVLLRVLNDGVQVRAGVGGLQHICQPLVSYEQEQPFALLALMISLLRWQPHKALVLVDRPEQHLERSLRPRRGRLRREQGRLVHNGGRDVVERVVFRA